MHTGSYNRMRWFAEKYLSRNDSLKILDVGSMDINGTYKDIFDPWEYEGLDLRAGKNVDIVVVDEYCFGIEKEYDVVISGNTMEHVKSFWNWIFAVTEACKSGGLVCIITPTRIGEHKHPLDCWRIYPDGMRFLIEDYVGMEILDIGMDKESEHNDTYVVARK